MPKILAIDDKQDNLITVSALLRNLIPDCTVIRLFQVSMRATKRQFKAAKITIPYQSPSLLKSKYPCFY